MVLETGYDDLVMQQWAELVERDIMFKRFTKRLVPFACSVIRKEKKSYLTGN